MKMILFCDKNFAIGKGNELLIHHKEDLKFFKETTMNNCVIMGKNTHLSIGKTLPNRLNVVLTSDKELTEQIKESKDDNIVAFNNLHQSLFYIVNENYNMDETFIIGGAKLYSSSINLVDTIYLNYYDEDLNGDVYFDNNLLKDFELVEEKQSEDDKKLYYRIYKRINKKRYFINNDIFLTLASMDYLLDILKNILVRSNTIIYERINDFNTGKTYELDFSNTAFTDENMNERALRDVIDLIYKNKLFKMYSMVKILKSNIVNLTANDRLLNIEKFEDIEMEFSRVIDIVVEMSNILLEIINFRFDAFSENTIIVDRVLNEYHDGDYRETIFIFKDLFEEIGFKDFEDVDYATFMSDKSFLPSSLYKAFSTIVFEIYDIYQKLD